MAKIIIIVISILLTSLLVQGRYKAGSFARHKRESPSDDAPAALTPDKLPTRQRQPFSIIGYSEDFKRGFVNPGAGGQRPGPRGVTFDPPSALGSMEAPPFIWVIPYKKGEREGKGYDPKVAGSNTEEPAETTQTSSLDTSTAGSDEGGENQKDSAPSSSAT